MKYVRRFIRLIQRVRKWIPIIWRLEDYDYRYGNHLLFEYLGSMEKFMRSDKAYSVESKTSADQIARWRKIYKIVYEETLSSKAVTEYIELYLGPEPLFEFIKPAYEREERLHKLLWEYYEKFNRNWWD